MEKTPKTVAIAGGAGVSIATLSDFIINEVSRQSESAKRLMMIFVPYIVAAICWVGVQLTSILREIGPDLRESFLRILRSGEKKRLEQEFGPMLQAYIDRHNTLEQQWIAVRDDRRCLEEIKKKCREEYVAAYVQMESYRSKGARLGVSFYASRSTMSGPKPLSSLQASASAGGGSLGLIEYGTR